MSDVSKRTGATLALSLLLLAPAAASAQDVAITGHVLDDPTGAPVADAVVTVEGRDAATVTDSTGAFWLGDLPTGLLRFRVERLGYWTTVVPVVLERSTSLLLRVPPNPVVADRIEVVIDVLEGRRNALPFAVRVFDAERLRPHVSLSLEAFLRRRAGLHLVPCRSGSRNPLTFGSLECMAFRGRAVPIRVWIDESPTIGGLDALFGYDVSEIQSVEVMGGCAMVRVYTRRFLDAVAAGRRRLAPVLTDCRTPRRFGI